PAFVPTGLHEGQHLVLLDQPALHAALEHRRLARGAQALAVHYAHAAPTSTVRFADERGQRLARFLAAQAVQVDLALDAPVALAQLARDVGAYARPPQAQRV